MWSAIAPSAIVDPNIDFTLVPGVDFPFGASRIRIEALVFINGTNPNDMHQIISNFKIITASGANTVAYISTNQTVIANTGLLLYYETLEMPIGADGISAPPSLLLRWTFTRLPIGGALPGILLAPELFILGWDA
jgi:hypothetical protein